MKTKSIVASLLLGSVFNSSPVVHAATQAKQAAHQAPKVNGTAGVYFRTIKVDGLDIFYREAGDKSKPTILLLHGFPSSSHMFRDLIRDLAPNYHLIAPDYPGFGQSSAPEPTAYNYTFDNLAATMNHFIDALGLKQFSLYVQDYGGPVGFRIASARPGLIQSIIVQNANAYTEGLGDALKPLVAYIQNPGESTIGPIKGVLSIEGTKWQYTDGAEDVSEIDPDSYITDQYYLNRPGNQDIQLALFRNYGTNLLLYAEWQAYFKKHQPLALVISGKNDKLFIAAGAMAYKKDLPKAEIHLLNGGHFVLEEKHEEAAGLIRSFLLKNNIK
ncbi:alpha/beta fold hydrolase [Mucilaginibacter sp. P25]|uniref:Pimeloyl-ACP methyl ester carboxylesterase n=1 Tax=Mucilaginibacter gossypii TaxID=551996 RepID=A0A1G8BUI6_9SPHI|nr:alpha/beta hydrolase [Mucilaginibacter gossypii]SDH36865.1 Pimeloyl-ACP methyl ester carboxylesterase [Mucilaginibacter gossypii]